jgi:hypothetical protein
MSSDKPFRLSWTLALVLVSGLALRLYFTSLSLAVLPPTSDEAMVLLQAGQIAQGERPLLFLAQPHQFPMGAYLLAPLADLLPPDARGARLPGLLLGLAAFWGGWLLVTRLGPPSAVWPGLVLAAFPSAYLLLFQAVYPVPQYEYTMAIWLAACWLAWLASTRPPPLVWGLAVLLGILCGLGLSVHMLSLSLLAPLALWACLAGGWRQLPGRTAALLLGLGVGLLPFLLAQQVHPNAAAYVTGLRPWERALAWSQLPVLEHSLAGALGAFSPLVPDFPDTLSLAEWAKPLLAVGFAVLLLAACAQAVRGLLGRPAAPPPNQATARADAHAGLLAALSGACILGVVLFLFGERANSGQYRYLLVAPWCLPLIFALLHRAAGRRGRMALGAAAILLALFNLATALALAAAWREPGLAARHAGMPDLAPVVAHLRAQGIRHCFASHWAAYRLTLASGGDILCAQPLNERFTNWPLPFKDEVARDSQAAYVLAKSDSFDAASFERELAHMGVSCRRTRAGNFRVYDRFRRKEDAREVALPSAQTKVIASHNPALASRLVDGDETTSWNSGQGQQEGMWLEISLSEAVPVTGLILNYHDYPHDRAGGVRLLARQGGNWIALGLEFPGELDPFQFINQLPIYGRHQQTLRFNPVVTDGLRVEVSSPRPDRLWTLSEVRVLCQAPPERAP